MERKRGHMKMGLISVVALRRGSSRCRNSTINPKLPFFVPVGGRGTCCRTAIAQLGSPHMYYERSEHGGWGCICFKKNRWA